MFAGFKYPGSSGANTGATAGAAGAGAGNSIFSAMGMGAATSSGAATSTSSASSILPGMLGGGGERTSLVGSAGAASSAANGDELPAGWRLVGSRHSGKEYYLHIASGHTQWDKPTEAEPTKKGEAGASKPNMSVFSVARMGMGLSSMLTQANTRLQTTLQQTKAANGTASGPGAKFGGSRGGQQMTEVFENERLDGNLHASTDPKRFSDRHAVPGAGDDEMPEGELPDGHEWTTEWTVDGSEQEAWMYASDFNELAQLYEEDMSHTSRQPTDTVRRRRWVRYSQSLSRGSGENPAASPSGSDMNRSMFSTSSTGTASSHQPPSWGLNDGQENGLFGELDEDDDPFQRTAQKAQTGFRVNMKFPHRGGKDTTKDYQSVALTNVNWLVNASDATTAPTDEMMREKTANLEERIKEATKKSVTVEKELRAENEAKARAIAQQQKQLDALVSQYRRVQRENETLQISVVAHRSTVEALRKEATEKDILLNEEQRALNAETAAANQALEEKAKALATARMRYKRDNTALAAAVSDAKKRLEQQKAKSESDAQDPLAKELKAEMEKVRKLHAKLEAVRQHRLVIEEESKSLFNLVVEKKANRKFQSKKKVENAVKDVDERIKSIKEEQGALAKKLAQRPEGDELRKLNARRNDIRSELGALKERRTMLLTEKRKLDGSD